MYSVLHIAYLLLAVFDEANLLTASKIKLKHKEYRQLSRELEKQHYERIQEGMTESIKSSKTHLEILALYSSIDSHATNIARMALEGIQNVISRGMGMEVVLTPAAVLLGMSILFFAIGAWRFKYE